MLIKIYRGKRKKKVNMQTLLPLPGVSSIPESQETEPPIHRMDSLDHVLNHYKFLVHKLEGGSG